MVKIWTKWEKNLEQKQGQIRALMLPSFNIGLERIRKKKKFFHESCQTLLINSFPLPAQ